jgi:hypothetical protein
MSDLLRCAKMRLVKNCLRGVEYCCHCVQGQHCCKTAPVTPSPFDWSFDILTHRATDLIQVSPIERTVIYFNNLEWDGEQKTKLT